MKASAIIVLAWVMISLPAFSQELPAECKSLSTCDEASTCKPMPPRDCTLSRDNRECGRTLYILGITKIHITDQVCEEEKARQNAKYSADKAACDAQKSYDESVQKQKCMAAIQACKSIAKACADLVK